MGDSKAMPGFGQVDLDLEDDFGAGMSPKAPPPGQFGCLELELSDLEEPVPPSTSRIFNADKRPSATATHDESTRIVSGDALSFITRPPPGADQLDEEGSTRAWAEIDQAFADNANEPSASRSGHQPAPSGSGVNPKDDRVAAMRELYARGDAAGALALAATLGQSLAPPAGGADSPDASIFLEYGEQSVDLEDGFGGLIPIDDDLAARATAAPPRLDALDARDARDARDALDAREAAVTTPPAAMPTPVAMRAVVAPPAAHLTLTERQSIPRLLQSMAEVSRLKIDHRAGFLLAHVDGMQTLEEILDVCAMPATEALSLFANLKSLGVIEFE